MELCDISATDLARMLRKREICSREITESVFRRIEEKEDIINAFIIETKDLALRCADLADKRFKTGKKVSPINGIPVAIKDNLCTKGITTTCGSRILENYVPPYNATVVDKVLKSGGVLVGKTNMDEFAMGSSCENSAFGPARNPVDPDRVPGGSSGGSAAAVAAGETVLAIGSDTGGSIRLPAAFCGVTGIKPTYGRVSRYGLVSYASSLDQVGAFGRSVEDCAMLLDVICGHDKRDSTSVDIRKPHFQGSIDRDIKGIRIGLPEEYFVEGLDDGVRTEVMNAVMTLEKNGAEIIEISLPYSKYAISVYYLVATAEASSNLARYDGVKYGIRSSNPFADSIGMYEETRSEGFGKEVKRRIMLGTYVLSAGYYDAYYLKAQKVRALIQEDFSRAFEKVDCMITPVSPCLPFRLGERMADPLHMYLVDVYTASLNLSGLPGMSINCGFVDGLPVGMQVIGKAFDEMTVLRVGDAYEKLAGDNRKGNRTGS
ncbi:MAG: Asp-tRNA(Asn)/Glu-tRNA(Gln) amidotransferase subunit GatA [Deltaproteobacteria bacterium]|nr:Asp-tRNA(Asn)/Glu-tRNA(Gln) amidotransferase subunit GatA [Deltaproteobacteria bacterium]MBW2137455.1 Asp-tRNA(Asn)/Glu-tRNA(Gln) amidotransferase subunit GatA [Deltaproteobacteria bacterium]